MSLVALWALKPMILSGFVGGALSDRFDRRLVSLVTAVIAWCSIGAMTLIAFLGVEATWPYYLLAAVNASASTTAAPRAARSCPVCCPPSCCRPRRRSTASPWGWP